MAEPSLHQSVLEQEAITALAIEPGGIYIDATFGRGGHSRAILSRLDQNGRLIAVDRDPQAIVVARSMSELDSRLEAVHARFSKLLEIAQSRQLGGRIDGVLFDLGVSSPQLDVADRGFSFLRDGPLDMRMNPEEGLTAADWINRAAATEIANVLFTFGEERHSRRIAKHIVREREREAITTTGRLAEIIKQAHPSWEKGKHPATRSFQAIRIFINKEFEEIDEGLRQALSVLQPGGRLVVISFHSLEDRIVKRFMTAQARGDDYPRHLPVTAEMLKPRLRILGKARKPRPEEVAANIRARSAVLRVAEKIA